MNGVWGADVARARLHSWAQVRLLTWLFWPVLPMEPRLSYPDLGGVVQALLRRMVPNNPRTQI